MKNYFFLFQSLYIFVVAKGNIEYDAPQEIKLYHTVDSSPEPEWFENGVVTLQNINTGNVLISQPSPDSDFLRKVGESAENDGLYRVKSVVKTSKGKEITFLSFLKSKSLIESGHMLSIVAALDQNGSVIGIKAYPVNKKSKVYGSASISFKVVEQGPVPDTASYILKLEREREAKERGATQDNRSFLAKYWMYLIPVVLFAVLSSSTGDPGPGGGGSR